jgi:peptidoglycan-associated lipoprotein
MNQAQKRMSIAICAVALLTVACAKKKVAAAPPPPPAPAAAPATSPQPASTPVRAASRQPAATAPAPHYPDAATRARIDELLSRIEDAYFDYDKAVLRPDAVKSLQADSTELRDILKDFPDYKLTIEGHCDERGSAEYNIALGDKRAEAAKSYLAQVGIPAAQLNEISFGKDRPVCEEHAESCWQRNRRIHIVAAAQPPAH